MAPLIFGPGGGFRVILGPVFGHPLSTGRHTCFTVSVNHPPGWSHTPISAIRTARSSRAEPHPLRCRIQSSDYHRPLTVCRVESSLSVDAEDNLPHSDYRNRFSLHSAAPVRTSPLHLIVDTGHRLSRDGGS
ncbi:MAG: hypothetical protein HQL50_11255 [Magnetococcales bacterium]|nr:hypothetical protein [Magnetococcales bacterium]